MTIFIMDFLETFVKVKRPDPIDVIIDYPRGITVSKTEIKIGVTIFRSKRLQDNNQNICNYHTFPMHAKGRKKINIIRSRDTISE